MIDNFEFCKFLLDENNFEYDLDELRRCTTRIKNKDKMKKVILFSRVSTISQELESQTNELKAEAVRLGYSTKNQILIEYKESAIQLSIDERRGIQELINSIESDNNINCVVIYEISRLSRQMKQLYELRDYFINKNIQLVCLKPYFRLLEDGKLSQTASILFSLMGTLSESEMSIKLERMLRGRLYKREQGRYIGGRMLLGYKVGVDDKIEIDTSDAETVRKIYQWYVDGRSMVWIAREIKERGLVDDDRWSSINVMITSIHNTLRRIEYTGRKGNTYAYPRIISDEVFEAAQKKLTRNKPKTINKSHYYGQGLIRVKKSNLMLSPTKSCYRVTRIGMHSELILSTKTIEEWLWKICEDRVKTTSKEKANKVFLHDQLVLNNKIHTVKMEIDSLNQRIDKINERIISGKLNEVKGDAMIQETEANINTLQERHNELLNKLMSLRPNEIDISDKKQVIHNEIRVIYASNYGMDGKTRIKLLEVEFKDGTVENYFYKSRSNKSWIEN